MAAGAAAGPAVRGSARRRTRTQVGIVGAGPAGLMLSHLLHLGGVGSVVGELRSRSYGEERGRGGVLEYSTVRVLEEVGVADRLPAQGMRHGGIYLHFDGVRHHID